MNKKKVICIRGGGYHLTVGRIYDVYILSNSTIFDYTICNDNKYVHEIEKDLFIDLDEYRSLKIESILS